ncbi:ATP-binding cassette domain-containing protein [Roseivirga pacifica]|nr:ATP-binding cassette domain-containing protein [Roseivirga pacifica]MCO6368693.1 ATP-binding cassette domain-containing protein [Roseivirga pacifica]MCO6372836.1 ATP-binding cassette domain-containing protein [Roseivirga pacifica]MCO6376895.1 ATP-binding cassette domain-containing protein [Roseivirga pacifica]MCO6377827.1 ATP-binding cassette domain-containing protein [Roseivirga pacifica]
MNMLHVDSVIKGFDTKQVLSDVFISCKKGDIVALMGRNGVGKSTLLRIIFGSISADEKFVRIGDKVLSKAFEKNDLIKYLPQDSFLPNHLKISTIIDLFCKGEKALYVRNHYFIKSIANKKSGELSGGERRLLEILLVVYSDAKYVLIDEPFNGVDPIHKEEIKRLIKSQSVHKGFIVTDHDYRSLLEISTRQILINDGATKEVKGIEELLEGGYLPKGD